MSIWSVNSSAASFLYHQVNRSKNWKNTLVKTKDLAKHKSSTDKEAKPPLSKLIETIEDEYEPVGNPLPQLRPKMSIQTRTKLVEESNSEWNENGQIIKENSSCYVQSTRQSKEEKMDAKISENEYILNNLSEYGIKDTAGLKHRDLNYVARSKSAKMEQRARAVQRSKTIYLNLSKGKNDGALAKLIEDSTFLEEEQINEMSKIMFI